MQKITRDGRLQLVLTIAFLYLSWNSVAHWVSSFSVSPAVKRAHLRSVSPSRLVIEYDEELDNTLTLHSNENPARHVPFFFQSIPINSADKEMLMTVKGIGPALAESIISHRQHFGPFKSLIDLTKIQGVGAKRAASLAPFLFFDEVP